MLKIKKVFVRIADMLYSFEESLTIGRQKKDSPVNGLSVSLDTRGVYESYFSDWGYYWQPVPLRREEVHKKGRIHGGRL